MEGQCAFPAGWSLAQEILVEFRQDAAVLAVIGGSLPAPVQAYTEGPAEDAAQKAAGRREIVAGKGHGTGQPEAGQGSGRQKQVEKAAQGAQGSGQGFSVLLEITLPFFLPGIHLFQKLFHILLPGNAIFF